MMMRMMLAAIEEREEDSLSLILSTLGGWPLIDGDWDASSFDVATLLARVRRSYSFTPLVLMYVGVDERNSVAHRILVGTSSVHSNLGSK